MKKIALLVLMLVATAIADEENGMDVQDLAEIFETDEETIQICMDEPEITLEEINAAEEKWQEIMANGIFNEETKQSVAKLNQFLACMMEKKNVMQDSKLVLSKILKGMDDHKNKELPSKEVITECVNTLNKDDEMNKEDRVFGLIVCFVSDYKGEGKK